MNTTGRILGFGVILTVLTCSYLAITAGITAISSEWGRLGYEWRATASGFIAVLLLVGLVTSYTTRTAIRRETSRSIGRVEAYNSFVGWYAAVKNARQAPDASTFASTRNSIILWGGSRVVRQINLLHDLLTREEVEMTGILEKAEHVFVEIKRDIGLSAFGSHRTIS